MKRLLKQMKMDAFQFRSFNRPVEDDGANEFDAASHHADDTPAAEAPAAPAPTRPAVAAAVRTAAPPVVAAPSPPPAKPDAAVAVGEAFGRLIREPEPRAKRKAILRLNLPPRPRIVDVKPASIGELLLTDVLNRLYRLGTTKISLVRQRGDA
ncbi:MAG: hypothetical protein C0434_13760 [Xanthomonadaceae bacterium]|nr:hypothetical protein [Xanthomonadaceae bacterium]